MKRHIILITRISLLIIFVIFSIKTSVNVACHFNECKKTYTEIDNISENFIILVQEDNYVNTVYFKDYIKNIKNYRTESFLLKSSTGNTKDNYWEYKVQKEKDFYRYQLTQKIEPYTEEEYTIEEGRLAPKSYKVLGNAYGFIGIIGLLLGIILWKTFLYFLDKK